jgi:predicted permease
MNKMINFLNVASEVADTTSEVVKEGMGWHPADALEVLPKAGIGMVVIFTIIGVIILATALLGKLTSKKKD